MCFEGTPYQMPPIFDELQLGTIIKLDKGKGYPSADRERQFAIVKVFKDYNRPTICIDIDDPGHPIVIITQGNIPDITVLNDGISTLSQSALEQLSALGRLLHHPGVTRREPPPMKFAILKDEEGERRLHRFIWPD